MFLFFPIFRLLCFLLAYDFEIGVNLRLYRNEKGLSQSQVAESAGISRISYRNIESGKSVPKVSTLQNIASSLGVRVQDLFAPTYTLKHVRFRALKKMNNRESILIEVARWLNNYNFLERELDDQKSCVFSELPNNLSAMPSGEKRAKDAAQKARKYLGLSEKEPIHDIAGLLESGGVKVYPLKVASDGFFGLSVSEEEGGPAIIVNVWDRISVERWIFSAAHELGHLLLHLDSYELEETMEDQEQEKEANIFASYFLMPQKVFEREWTETHGLPFLERVFKVKRIFLVSYKTVLYRLSENLGRSIWGKFQNEYKQKFGKTLKFTEEPKAISADKFYQTPEFLRSQEPEPLTSSHFVENRLYSLVRNAIEKEVITLNRGAEILKVNTETMRNIASSWVD